MWAGSKLRLGSKSPEESEEPGLRFLLHDSPAFGCTPWRTFAQRRPKYLCNVLERHKSPRNFYVGYTPRQSIKVVIRQPNRGTILLWQHVGNFGARDYSSQKKKQFCASSKEALMLAVQAVPRRRATSSTRSVKLNNSARN